MIGTLGRSIVFNVSAQSVLTFRELTRDTAGRWAMHDTMGTKPKAEYLGADNRKITIPIYLSASLGVKPRRVLDALARLAESGEAEYFVVGGKPLANNPVRVVSTSETWGAVYNRGELAKATVSVTLEEYV